LLWDWTLVMRNFRLNLSICHSHT